MLAQSHTSFDLIVIDDGSTDGSTDVVRGIADPRLRLVIQKNGGECAARNRGLHEAASEWVSFLDADDEWHPEFLATAMALHKTFPEAAICGTGYQHSSGAATRRNSFHNQYAADDTRGFLINYFEPGDKWMALCACSLLLRKDVLLEAGAFPLGVIRAGDLDTWVRVALRHRIAWVPSCQVTVYDDADNRTAPYCYIGNWPFFQSLRAYRALNPNADIPAGTYQWLARIHTSLLKDNWLANNRQAMSEIIRDCAHVPGFSFKCRFWQIMSFVPYPVVLLLWRLRSLIAGRGGKITPSLFRGIRLIDRTQTLH